MSNKTGKALALLGDVALDVRQKLRQGVLGDRLAEMERELESLGQVDELVRDGREVDVKGSGPVIDPRWKSLMGPSRGRV